VAARRGAEAVPAQVGRDGGVADGLAGRAGAGVSLVFRDVGCQLGQLGDLMPGRFGVIGSGLLGQVVSAASAATGYKGDDLLKTPWCESSLEGGRMSGLSAGFFARRWFDDRLGCLGWISGGRQGGIGGVVTELIFEGDKALLQGGESLLQARDDLVTLPTSRASRFVHTRILGTRRARSCLK
jgi:hypothetical protein